jgi:hypothetical protein
MTQRSSEYGAEYQMGLQMAAQYVLRISMMYRSGDLSRIPQYISVISALDSETHRKVKAWWAAAKKS